nr:hypothetical protein [Tanacetum cinerariifolium]
ADRPPPPSATISGRLPPPKKFSGKLFWRTPKILPVSRFIRSTIHRCHALPLFSTVAAAATLTISTAATLPPPHLHHHHHQHANATAILTSSSSSTPPAATCYHTIATIPRMSPPMRLNRHQKPPTANAATITTTAATTAAVPSPLHPLFFQFWMITSLVKDL